MTGLSLQTGRRLLQEGHQKEQGHGIRTTDATQRNSSPAEQGLHTHTELRAGHGREHCGAEGRRTARQCGAAPRSEEKRHPSPYGFAIMVQPQPSRLRVGRPQGLVSKEHSTGKGGTWQHARLGHYCQATGARVHPDVGQRQGITPNPRLTGPRMAQDEQRPGGQAMGDVYTREAGGGHTRVLSLQLSWETRGSLK